MFSEWFEVIRKYIIKVLTCILDFLGVVISFQEKAVAIVKEIFEKIKSLLDNIIPSLPGGGFPLELSEKEIEKLTNNPAYKRLYELLDQGLSGEEIKKKLIEEGYDIK